ncbi:hypothetical protein [Fluviicola sp.]|uniref:hypothetical protein n=1 Tax=Fluviicola sp. TaxID=1917219 RepID=UPI0031D34826
MKRFLFISGLSLCSMTVFSQQQASSLKKAATPVPVETPAKQEPVSDSLVPVSTQKVVNVQTLPVSNEHEPASKGQQTPALNSMKRKPE